MKKINFTTILIQVLGIILFAYGFFQLKIFSVSEKYNFAFKSLSYQSKKNQWSELYGKENVFDFISSVMLWKFYGLLIGVILIAFINGKSKISILNTLLSTISTYIVFFFLFEPHFSIFIVDDFGLLFSNNFETKYLIGGVILSFIGLVLLYLSYHLNRLKSRKRLVEI